MEEKKRAWLYCAIDAPEDTHGTLKKQFKQLCDYAEQMGFEPAGSSADLGGKPLLKRIGFGHFVEAVRSGKANILVIVSSDSLSRAAMQIAQFQALATEYNLEVFSTLEGRLPYRCGSRTKEKKEGSLTISDR